VKSEKELKEEIDDPRFPKHMGAKAPFFLLIKQR